MNVLIEGMCTLLSKKYEMCTSANKFGTYRRRAAADQSDLADATHCNFPNLVAVIVQALEERLVLSLHRLCNAAVRFEEETVKRTFKHSTFRNRSAESVLPSLLDVMFEVSRKTFL